MGGTHTPIKKRKTYLTSLTVDVDVDAELLEDNGYHHEDDCPAAEEHSTIADRQRLSDWHDHAHGLSLWASCVYEPCNLLTDEFRSTP